jgi:hypothetical protein
MKGPDPAEPWELDALGRCPNGHYKRDDGTMYWCDYCKRKIGPCNCMVEEHVRFSHMPLVRSNSS